jgi:hypothetical protein
VSAVRVTTTRLNVRRRLGAVRVTVVDMRPPARRVRARRAATRLAVGVAAFLAVQLATDQAIRQEWVPLRDPVYFDKLALLRTHPAFLAPPSPDKPTTVLCVGSSRTLNAIDAAALGSDLTTRLGRRVEAFNFGVAGAGPVTAAVYLRRLLAAGATPDVVLVEVHPVFLAGQWPDPPEGRWLQPHRLRPDEFAVVRGMGFAAGPTPAHGPRGRVAAWFEHRGVLIDRYAPGLLLGGKLNAGHEPDRFGFARKRELSPAEAGPLHALTRGQYAAYLDGYRPTGPGVAAIAHTLDQCRAAGVRAALVLTPESSAFRGWYDPAGLGDLEATLVGFSRRYGVPVFDGRTWLPDELVGDGHHPTGAGADDYTARLAPTVASWLTQR